jgi:AraC-like DNA-binding protein
MKILALLPDNARRVLERSLTEGQHVSRAVGAESVATALLEGRCDALILDPEMLDTDEFELVMGALNESGVPMMLYTALGPLAARRILDAVDLAARELVLRGSEDAPELLRRRLAELVAPSAPAVLLSKTASHFRAFPEPLQTVSVSLFGRATLPRWVNGLVRESGLARRTVDRWMHKGGLTGAARLLDAARLARVWEPLVEHGVGVEEVAVRCGYTRLRLLTAHTRRMMGVAPHELRDHYTRVTFSTRLAESLRD